MEIEEESDNTSLDSDNSNFYLDDEEREMKKRGFVT